MMPTSSTVMTVRGPIPATELGFVQPHEHVFVDLASVPRYADVAPLAGLELMTTEVAGYAEIGGSTLVELTTLDLARDGLGLQQVSRSTGVHIVMGTGWFLEHSYPDDVRDASVPDLTARLLADIEDGETGHGIRPGIIGEIGVAGNRLTSAEERVHRAVARAAERSGLAVSTHTPVGAAFSQLECLTAEGLNPARVIVGHCDVQLDLEHNVRLLATGANIEFDLLGSPQYGPDEQRADLIVDLCRRGYSERILISQDVGFPSQLASNGGDGWTHLIKTFVPMLRERGASDEEVALLTSGNAARILPAQ